MLKKAAMERERDSLNQSDALSLKEQQTEISRTDPGSGANMPGEGDSASD